jgi:hypothetical protein
MLRLGLLVLAILALFGVGMSRIASRPTSNESTRAAPIIAEQTSGAQTFPSVFAQGGPSWDDLSASQRATLLPLKVLWIQLNSGDKQRWLAVAKQLDGLSTKEQARAEARMTAWAKLTPRERTRVRLGFVYARQMPANERQRRWSEYQSVTTAETQIEAGHFRGPSSRYQAEPSLGVKGFRTAMIVTVSRQTKGRLGF